MSGQWADDDIVAFASFEELVLCSARLRSEFPGFSVEPVAENGLKIDADLRWNSHFVSILDEFRSSSMISSSSSEPPYQGNEDTDNRLLDEVVKQCNDQLDRLQFDS